MRPRTSFLTLESAGLYRRLHAVDAADLLAVSPRQVRAWIRGDATPPATTWRLLEILALGMLPWEGWEGFSVDPRDGRLWSPNGYTWLPGQLTHWPMEMQRLALIGG